MLTGLTSLVVVVAPVVLAWLVEPLSSGDGWQAAGTGAALWLLVSGANLAVGEVTISVVPLLGLALLVGVGLARCPRGDGRRVHRRRALAGHPAAPPGRRARCVVGRVCRGRRRRGRTGGRGPVPGHAAVARAARGGRPAAGARPGPATRRPRRPGRARSAARDRRGCPTRVRRAVRPGLLGAGVLLGVGLVVVLAMVALSWNQVTTISTAVAAGGLGGVVLALAQVASLPNLALWAVSFMAGPGFRVVEGGSVDWSGSKGGLLPMVPVLAALPQPGDFPWFTVLSVLVVVAVGAFVARRALAAVARLSRLRTKLAVALAACTVTALALAVLDLVAGGSAGQFRLSAVGAPTGRLFLALLLELGLGALVVVVGRRSRWRAAPVSAGGPRHRPRAARARRPRLGLGQQPAGPGRRLGRGRRPVPGARGRGRPRRHRRRRAGRAGRHPDVRRAGCPTT